ncbi:Acetyltransferase [Pseudomonas savastanoi pv. nerii]|nr:Acetyltransferase [Pseudomonas savastanoi pv. nerii]
MSLIVRAMADSDWSSLAQIFEQPVFRWWTLLMPYQSISDIKNLLKVAALQAFPWLPSAMASLSGAPCSIAFRDEGST